MHQFVTILFLTALLWSVAPRQADTAEVIRSYSLAEFSHPVYDRDFSHFSYVNSDAPKGGMITLGSPGTFNSLNSLILRGVTPRALGLIYDTLMVGSGDEIDVVYGLIAQEVEYPEDKTWVIFHLRQDAKFHDGHPITADDFVFTWQTIQQYGNPFLRSFLTSVKDVKALTPHQLQVTFHTRNEIKPLIQVATTLVPQPEHWWTADQRDISKTTLEPPLGSGPYRIGAVVAGRSIIYERVEDYWGQDLSVRRGFNNFDTIKVDYYRDEDVLFEAFKSGAYDFRIEYRAQWWAEGYQNLSAIDSGLMETRTIPLGTPLGAQGFRCNTRRFQFSDSRVREGLSYLFDFEWTQRVILYGQYQRVKSNFPNSDFGASGLPLPEERAILERFRDQIPERVFTDPYEPPQTDGSGRIRNNLRQALALFRAAGWIIRDNQQLIHQASNVAMTIEFITTSRSMERVINPYLTNLRRAGIQTTLKLIDPAQYQQRLDQFDFDCVVIFYRFFAPPGEELKSYFGSLNADIAGAANYAGIKDPVIDTLIDEIIAAESLEQSQLLTRALDRVLLWGFYMIPQWYHDTIRLAYWTKFSWPETHARYNSSSGSWNTWWYDPTKPAAQ